MGQHERQASSESLELAHLYERAPVGLCVTDRQHRYVRINQRLCDINGVSAEEHIGRTPGEVIPQVADQIVSMFQSVIDSSEPVLGHEVRGPTSAHPGEERIFLGDHCPLLSKAGRVLYVHTMVRDVTVERQAEAVLKESKEALEARVKNQSVELMSVSAQLEHVARVAAMGQLAGSMADELSQPLVAILANAQAALRFMKADNPAMPGIHDLTLGERLMVARERCGLTKVAVARMVLDPGKDKKPRSATIGAWERETMGLTLPSLRRLADLYEKVGGISPSWVVVGEGPLMQSDLDSMSSGSLD